MDKVPAGQLIWRCGWCDKGIMSSWTEHCMVCGRRKDAYASIWDNRKQISKTEALTQLGSSPPAKPSTEVVRRVELNRENGKSSSEREEGFNLRHNTSLWGIDMQTTKPEISSKLGSCQPLISNTEVVTIVDLSRENHKSIREGLELEQSNSNTSPATNQTSSNPEVTALSYLRNKSSSNFRHSSKSRETDTILPFVHTKTNLDSNSPSKIKNPEPDLNTHTSLGVSYGNIDSSKQEHETNLGPLLTPLTSNSKPKAVSKNFNTPFSPEVNVYLAVPDQNDQNAESRTQISEAGSVTLTEKGSTSPHRSTLLGLPAINVIGDFNRKLKAPIKDTSAKIPISGSLMQETLHLSSSHARGESKSLREDIITIALPYALIVCFAPVIPWYIRLASALEVLLLIFPSGVLLERFDVFAYIAWLKEPPLEKKRIRLRWKCRHCGEYLYDDFQEIRPNAVNDYEQTFKLQPHSLSSNDNNPPFSTQNSRNDVISKTSSIFHSLRRLWVKNIHQPRPDPSQELSAHVDQAQEAPSAPPPDDLFLLVCIPHRKYAVKLVHMNVCDLLSDQNFFPKLKDIYHEMRGRWISILSMRKLNGIQFVYFEMYSSQLVDIKKRDDIPPESKKDVYAYRPIPAKLIPPVGSNFLMHLYEHPEEAESTPVCLDKIPKKIRQRLLVEPERGTGLGWGIHLVESLDRAKLCSVGLVGFIASVMFGVLWSIYRNDVQGGFGVSACMMVILTFVLGIVQATLELR